MSSPSESAHPRHEAPPNRAPNWDETARSDSEPDRSADQRAGRSAEERERRIAERAHQLAEARGFTPGAELDDWLQAEREIDEQWATQQ